MKRKVNLSETSYTTYDRISAAEITRIYADLLVFNCMQTEEEDSPVFDGHSQGSVLYLEQQVATGYDSREDWDLA